MEEDEHATARKADAAAPAKAVPLVLVLNAAQATEFEEEVGNSPEALLQLSSANEIELQALSQLLRVCWTEEADAELVGLEDVSGLKKIYSSSVAVEGLELLAICLAVLVAETPMLQSANDGTARFRVGENRKVVLNILKDMAAKILSRETKIVLDAFPAFGYPAWQNPALVRLGYTDDLETKLRETFKDGVSVNRIVVILNPDGEGVASVLLAVASDEADFVRQLLEKGLASQDDANFAEEAEDETELQAEDRPIQVLYVTRGLGEGNEQEGTLELVMPPLSKDQGERETLANELLTKDDDAAAQACKSKAWEQLSRGLPNFGRTAQEGPGASVTMSRDAERDDKLSNEEKEVMLCVVVTVANVDGRRETTGEAFTVSDQPDVAHPEQREVAKQIFQIAETALFGSQKAAWAARFSSVAFVILTPNFNSLQTQTEDRVMRAKLDGGRVLKHTKVPRVVMSDHRKWMESQASDPKTLLVIIADECHYAPTKRGAHDWFLNNKRLKGGNVLRLLVSATPQNVLTSKSRIDETNVVAWHNETSLYRSMDYFVESATWAVPACVGPLQLAVKARGSAETIVEVDPQGLHGCRFRYPMHDFSAFCQVLDKAVRDAIPAGVVERAGKTGSFFNVKREKVTLTLPGEVRICESAFQAERGLMHWLGFASEQRAIEAAWSEVQRDGRKKSYSVRARGIPLLCDTEQDVGADCLPRRRQRVVRDDSFDAVRARIERVFGKRTSKNRRADRIKVAKSTPLFDGHIIMAEYLLSLTYLAVYRVDHERLWDCETERETIFRPLELADVGQLALNEGLLQKFTLHLGIAHKLWPQLEPQPDLQVGKFSIGGGVERAKVQHVLNELLKATLVAAWDELDSRPVKRALCARLGKKWVKKLEGLQENSNAMSPDRWRMCLEYVISEKLACNREDLTENQANTIEAWYNETDRLLHDLLDVHPRFRTGRMAVIRVYETDENLSIQDGLRSALKKLGLSNEVNGGVLSVVADVGGSDGKRGDTNLRCSSPTRSARAMRRATNLFSQLEPWALERDLRHPSKQNRGTGTKETLVDRVNQSLAEAKACEERYAREANREPKPVQMTAKYEDLENLPTIVILCEKGRMGDTFPHSFRFLDIRLRSSPTYSTFVQEFGRVCRYPGLNEDEATFANFEVTRRAEVDTQNPGAGDWNDTELEQQLSQFCADRSARAFLAKGGSYAVLDPGNEVRFHFDSELQLRSRLREELLKPHSTVPRARFGTWTAKRYLHILPTVLMNAARFNAQVQKAVEHKYRDAWGHRRVDQCIPGPIDLYVSGRGQGKKAAKPSAERTSIGEVVVTNPLHDLSAYRQQRPTCSDESGSGSKSRSPHYDDRESSETDPRRLLLMAQCQQGKTGTYLHFIRLLKDAIEVSIPAPPERLPLVPRDTWSLPYWRNLVVSTESPGFPALRGLYDKVGPSQAHRTVFRQRFLALFLASEWGTDWKKLFLTYLRSADGEAIQSEAGTDKIKSLERDLQNSETTDPPLVGATCQDPDRVRKCINFDGRLSGAWRETLENFFRDTAARRDLETARSSYSAANRGLPLTFTQGVRSLLSFVQRSVWDSGAPDGASATTSMGLSSYDASIVSVSLFASHRADYASVAARPTSSSFDASYFAKQYIVRQVHLVGDGVCLSAPYNGFHGLSVGEDGDLVRVSLNAQSQQLSGKISTGETSLVSLLEVDLAQRKVCGCEGVGSVRWCFVPSYCRAGVALLDYEKAIPETSADKATVVCIVVRSGKQFEDYVAAYGSAYLILGMPSSFAPPGKDKLVHAARGGIGFARLFVQLAAYELGLRWVWVLDDNVDVCYQRRLVSDGAPGEAQAEAPEACTFATVMSGVESVVDDDDAALEALREEQRMACPSDLHRLRRAQQSWTCEAVATTKAELTGGANQYGLIGVRRNAQACAEPDLPFTVSASVHSFVYLHVKQTVDAGAFYPTKTFWEDIEFNHLVDEAGLVCLKMNRFFHHKKDLKLGSASRTAKATARFDRMEEALTYFGRACGGLELVDPISKRLHDFYSEGPGFQWATEVREQVRRSVPRHPGKTPVPVCVLESSSNPAFNEVSLHLPGDISKLLLVLRCEDAKDFAELVEGQDSITLTRRKGLKLDFSHEAQVVEPVPSKLILVEANARSSVSPDASTRPTHAAQDLRSGQEVGSDSPSGKIKSCKRESSEETSKPKPLKKRRTSSKARD